MNLSESIEARMKLTKVELATLDELETRISGCTRISEIYSTIESDLSEIGYKEVRVIEYLRSGKLYNATLHGENNFRHYSNKKQQINLEDNVFRAITKYDKTTRKNKAYFPFKATPLLDNCLLGTIIVKSKIGKKDSRLIKEYAKWIGVELSPRYYRKEKEKEIKKERERVNKLVADVIHSIRGDLTTPMGYSSLALDLLKKTENIRKGKEIIKKLQKQLNKASKKVLYLQEVFNTGIGTKIPYNITSILEELIEEKKEDEDYYQIKIRNELGNSNYICNVNPTALELAFRELITNAFKYTLKEGSILINGKQGEERAIFCFRNGPTDIEFKKIKEEGKGMRIDKIFERGDGHGTGLGLDFVKKVIEEEHKGKINVTTENSEMIFRIELPLTH